MARIGSILSGQARNRWRLLMGGGGRALVTQGLILVGTAVVLQKYVKLLATLPQEHYQLVLTGVLGTWLGLPLSGLAAGATPLPIRQFPLTAGDLWRLRAVALLASPMLWLLAWATVRTAVQVSGSALLLAPTGLAAGLAIADLLPTVRRAWAVLALPLALLAVRAPGAGQAVALAGAVAGAIVAFRYALMAPGPGGRRPPSRWRLPLPGLLRKDLAAAGRMLDVYLLLAVALSFTFYAVRTPQLAREAVLAAPLLCCLCASNFLLNVFGLDSGPGFDRYRLLPMSGRQILESKALSSAVVLGGPVLPAVVAAFWHLGWVVGLTVLAEVIAMLALQTAWGSWISVREPAAVEPYRMSSGGSMVSALAALGLAVIPAWAAFVADERPWLPVAVAAAAVAIWPWALRRAGRELERRGEQIRAALR